MGENRADYRTASKRKQRHEAWFTGELAKTDIKQTDESTDSRKQRLIQRRRTAEVNVKTGTQFTVKQQGSLAAYKLFIDRNAYRTRVFLAQQRCVTQVKCFSVDTF